MSDLRRFRQMISRSFSREELRTLCFDLKIDYEDFVDSRKTEFVRELVQYVRRRQMVDVFIDILKMNRPGMTWEAYLEVLELPEKMSPVEQQQQLDDLKLKIVGQRPYDLFDHFKNREKARKTLRKLLSEPATRMISIIGRAGMGKTAVASKILSDVEQGKKVYRVQGIVYLSSRINEISLEQIYFSFTELFDEANAKRLRQLWSNTAVSTEEKIVKLLSSLSDGHYILLLDNLEDVLDEVGKFQDEELELFVRVLLTRNTNTKLLVTSRIPVQLQDSLMRYDQHVPLIDGLPVEESIELLRELDVNRMLGLFDAPKEQLQRIAELTHGVPRALEIVASILAHEPLISVNDLVSDFFGTGIDARSLAEEMYKLLEDESLTIVKILAVFGRPVEADALEYVASRIPLETDLQERLRFLIQSHTITVNREEKVVSLHPIDCDYIYNLMATTQPEELEFLEKSAADYYSSLATPPTTWHTLADLREKWLELVHRTRAKQFNMAHDILMQIDEKYLFQWGYYKPLLDMRKKLVGHLQTPIDESVNFERISRTYLRLGSSERAVDYAKRGLKIASQRGETAQKLLAALGEAYIYLGEYESAIDHFRRGLPIVRSRGNKHDQGFYLAQMGFAHYNMADTDRMLACYEKALSIAEETNDILLEMLVLGYFSKGFSLLGDYHRTIEYAEKALRIARRVGDRYEECLRLSDLGDGSIRLGHHADAISYLTESLEIAEELGAKSAIGYRHWLLGWAQLGTDQYYEAAANLESALGIAEQIKNPHLLQKASTHLLQTYLLLNDLENTRKVMGDVALVDGVLRTQYHFANAKAISLLHDGDLEGCVKYFRAAVDYSRRILQQAPEFFEAWFGLSVAEAGLTLLDSDNAEQHINEAVRHFRRASEFCAARGIALEVQRSLDLMRDFDRNDHLLPLWRLVDELT